MKSSLRRFPALENRSSAEIGSAAELRSAARKLQQRSGTGVEPMGERWRFMVVHDGSSWLMVVDDCSWRFMMVHDGWCWRMAYLWLIIVWMMNDGFMVDVLLINDGSWWLKNDDSCNDVKPELWLMVVSADNWTDLFNAVELMAYGSCWWWLINI